MLERIRALQEIGNESRRRPRPKGGCAPRQSRPHAGSADAQARSLHPESMGAATRTYRRFTIDDCFFLNGLPTWEAIEGNPATSATGSRTRIPENNFGAGAHRRRRQAEESSPNGTARIDVVFEHSRKAGARKARTENRRRDRARHGESLLMDAFFDTWLERTTSDRAAFITAWPTAHRELLGRSLKSDAGLIGTGAGVPT